ncbi:MAG TPA: zinc ribbon domain-containing protein [Ktedonobacteraceae bacterium]|nr:zinc ribbon domain-containing protein [Ktedonobacteraceae bacterium]
MAKTQTLSFPIRLPDAMQAEALRLLDASRLAINTILIDLWPHLDHFAADRRGPAWKQVEKQLLTRSGHGSRQERNEMEAAGRILRAQATRKQIFTTVLPLLTDTLICPADEKRPPRKDHREISTRVRALRTQLQEGGEDADAFMAMTNVLEQACNRYLQTEAFPTTYEQLQPVPVLSVGHVTFAGDDGMQKGQTYRARIEHSAFCDIASRQEHVQASLWLRLRAPNDQQKWTWGAWSTRIALPDVVCAYLEQGASTQAPCLREIRGDDGQRMAVLDLLLEVPAKYVSDLSQEQRVLGFDWGVRSLITVSILEKPAAGDAVPKQVSRPLFLDTGGIDGRQARLRREIDRLKACKQRYMKLIMQAHKAQQEQQTPLPAHLAGWQSRIEDYDVRIKQCWKTYARRNRELAHLASNLLILQALVFDCRIICGENLTTLKTMGRGRGVRGRFRNWRNNATIRGELWRMLTYKCRLTGIRTRTVEPRGTTHTCPRCHKPARTFASPAPSDRRSATAWGAWLFCENEACGWNGARDYAASLNIAVLGMAYLVTYCETGKYIGFRMTSEEVKPCSYSGQGATRLLLSQGITPRPVEGKHIYYAGWSYSIRLCTSHPKATLSVLCTAQLRKKVLRSA